MLIGIFTNMFLLLIGPSRTKIEILAKKYINSYFITYIAHIGEIEINT